MRCAGHVEDPRRCEKEWHRCDTLGYQSITGDGDSNLQQLQVGGEGMEDLKIRRELWNFKKKNFMYQAWSIEKIHQPVRCCFFGGSKKKRMDFVAILECFPTWELFFVERWHPSNQSRRYCLLLMKGYRYCPQIFEVIISVICLVLREMYVVLRMCMFIFFCREDV